MCLSSYYHIECRTFGFTASSTGGPVGRHSERHQNPGNVRAKQSFLFRVQRRDTRPGGLSVPERALAGFGRKAASHVLDTRRRISRRSRRTRCVRARILHGQRRRFRVLQLQARAVR